MTLRLQSLELKIKRLDRLLVLLADIIIFSPKLTAIIYFQHQYKKIATGRSIINRKVIIWASF